MSSPRLPAPLTSGRPVPSGAAGDVDRVESDEEAEESVRGAITATFAMALVAYDAERTIVALVTVAEDIVDMLESLFASLLSS